MANNTVQKIKLHAISPINIGTGNYFDPSAFWVDVENKKLIEFTVDSLFSVLNEKDKEEFYDICNSGTPESITRLYVFINDKKPKGYREVSVCDDLIQKYQKVLNGNSLNKFEVKRTFTNPNTGNPYIPGSSLKGAVRTAYISSLVQQGKNFTTEQDILGGRFHEDVFTTLKVSDLLSDNNGQTKIVYGLRIGKKNNKEGAPVMLETIEQNSSFIGTISLNHNIQTPLKFNNIDDVLTKLDVFYTNIFKDIRIGIKSPSQAEVDAVKKTLKNKSFLCRLGSLIGAESHTVEGFRQINIRNLDKNLPYSTTYLLSSETEKQSDCSDTFGWCLIELLN